MSVSGVASGSRDRKQDWIPVAVLRSLYRHRAGVNLDEHVDKQQLLHIDEHFNNPPSGGPVCGAALPDLYYALPGIS